MYEKIMGVSDRGKPETRGCIQNLHAVPWFQEFVPGCTMDLVKTRNDRKRTEPVLVSVLDLLSEGKDSWPFLSPCHGAREEAKKEK